MQPVALRQRLRASVFPADCPGFEEHVMAVAGIGRCEAENLIKAAILAPEGVAAAGGPFVMAEHDQGAATIRVAQAVADRLPPPGDVDGLGATDAGRFVSPYRATDELALARAGRTSRIDDDPHSIPFAMAARHAPPSGSQWAWIACWVHP
jgi:hypothetical protein